MQLPYKNVIQPIVERATNSPDEVCLIFVGDDGVHVPLSADDLHTMALDYAAMFEAAGVGLNDIVLLLLNHSQELMAAFWGAMYVGAVPSIYPYLTPKMDLTHYAQQVTQLAEHVGVHTILTDDIRQPHIAALNPSAQLLTLDDVEEVDDPDDIVVDWEQIEPDRTAFLQFSSGTTGMRKGVIITHRGILNQLEALSDRLRLQPGESIITWLPLHHDMGLVGNFMHPLVIGTLGVIMSPAYWLGQPQAMFHAITKYKGAVAYMPNFAFNISAHNLRDSELEGVDLSSMRYWINGAEPVRHSSMVAFRKRFMPYGLGEHALKGGYGMAENTLSIAITPEAESPLVDWVDRLVFQSENRAVLVDESHPNAMSVVASGYKVLNTEYKIVDADGNTLPERHVGEIMVTSNCMFGGYYKRSDLNASVFEDGWYFTGDIGYIGDGYIFISGRKKDLIISGGKNIYPEDLEEVANGVKGIRAGRVVVFGVDNAHTGSEDVVMLCEVRGEVSAETKRQLTREIRHRISAFTEATVADIRYVSRDTIQKTSSGKLARNANREIYLQLRDS